MAALFFLSWQQLPGIRHASQRYREAHARPKSPNSSTWAPAAIAVWRLKVLAELAVLILLNNGGPETM